MAGAACKRARQADSVALFSRRKGETMRRIALAVALGFAAAVVAAGSAGAATSKSSFEVFVEPTISAASNGLTLETELEGTFNVAAKTASGSGSYTVMSGS